MTPYVVSLIGAGPGDPDLITVKALKRIRDADVIAYDRLVNQEIMTEAKLEAELIYVGKHGLDCKTTWKQEDINELLIQKAMQGKQVVRLKGGDPFIFGRGGEEALALRRAGISFEIIPGISSAIAAPAYAGIPVTHRYVASSFAVIAGHEDPLKAESTVHWDRLATAVDTLVILMGVGNCESIVSELIVHGRDPETPAAAIRYGTTKEQETVTAKLVDLPRAIREANLKAPAALVVGEVVRLREELVWFMHDKVPQVKLEADLVWVAE
ncbi:MAG: uroporphyrinogen-III C-methyltransferase [Trueperaceae bacterium]|nr:uroporphyrinogen-III C-methyltransferase [Trueperaceae bacterium]